MRGFELLAKVRQKEISSTHQSRVRVFGPQVRKARPSANLTPKKRPMSSSKTRQKRRAETEYDSFTLADVLGETSAFTTQSLSADRRRTHTTTHEVELPSPVKKKARIVASRPNLFADVGDGFKYVFDDLAAPPSPIRQSSGAGVKPRAKRYLSSVRSS
jgi:hypothetical protein